MYGSESGFQYVLRGIPNNSRIGIRVDIFPESEAGLPLRSQIVLSSVIRVKNADLEPFPTNIKTSLGNFSQDSTLLVRRTL